MAYTATWELQEALYQVLTSDTDLMAKATGVYNTVSEDAKFPYIVMDSFSSTAFNTRTSIGENFFVTIHVFSYQPSNKQVSEIMNLILLALVKQEITLDNGFKLQKHKDESTRILSEAQGNARHGVLQCRFYVNK